jgi:integrase
MAKVAYRPRRRNGQEKWYWVADFRDRQGIRRIVQSKFTRKEDEKAAGKWLRSLLDTVARDEFVAPSDERKFAELIPAYQQHIETKRLQGHVRGFTITGYLSTIKTHIEPFFKDTKLRSIDVPLVEQFILHMCGKQRKSGKPLSPRTVNKTVAKLSEMMDYAARINWVRTNPCVHVDKPKQRKRRVEVLNQDECNRLVAAAGSQRDRVLYYMAIETGMREGELIGLRWANVDLAVGLVHIVQTIYQRQDNEVKTDTSRRTNELSMGLLRLLKEWKLACPKAAPGAAIRDLVFPNSVGGAEDAHNLLRRDLRPALERAGVKKIRFHDLRHTAISLMLASGMSAVEVAAKVGHSSTKMTLDVYGHFIPRPGQKPWEVFGGNQEVATDSEAAPDTRSESVA